MSVTAPSECRRPRLLKDQIQLVKRRDSDRYEIAPIEEPLSFEKGFYAVIHASQMLAQKNDGIILVGIAGPAGAGKSAFTEKMLGVMPSLAAITMDNYNDASRIVDGNFDDPQLTDYDTLLENICGLKAGNAVQVPIYDFKSSSRIGYRTVEVPSSRIVIIEGIYALSEKLWPLLDLRVSITGGVHFDLVKRVLRDIQRAGQDPEEIIHQISETVYPMYKAFIEPDLETAHIMIINKFSPFTGFQNPTYVLKSTKIVADEQIKRVMLEEHRESWDKTYDMYLLPPGEDPEACQSYLRMRNRDGKYNLMFEEWVTDSPFIISPRITFEVSVRLLGGLMALGYTIAAIVKRTSHIFFHDKVIVKIDWLQQLNRKYVQVQGRDRSYVKHIAEQLGLDGTYVSRTYIEQIQLEKIVDELMALPQDLKTKLSIHDDTAFSPKEALSQATAYRRTKYLSRNMSRSFSTNREKHLSIPTKLAVDVRSLSVDVAQSRAEITAFQESITRFSECLSTFNQRLNQLTQLVETLNSNVSTSQRNLASQSEANRRSNGTGTTNEQLRHSSSSSQLAALEDRLTREINIVTLMRHRMASQLEELRSLLEAIRGARFLRDERSERSGGAVSSLANAAVSSLSNGAVSSLSNAVPFLTLAIGGLAIVLFRCFPSSSLSYLLE